ncbi:MAG: Tryptophan--tRNA ligase 2 [Hyphomicrobiaceae bacterium hypho_1]
MSCEQNKKIVLTGDRPTGPLHIGHYVGSLKTRVEMQDSYETYILIADMQALTDNARMPEVVSSNIMEVACDYIAAGIDPERTQIVVQSMVPELAELYMYLSNLVGVGRIERNPTVKMEIKQKGITDHVPAGFFMYPVSQVADIVGFGADFVPVGDDQTPMLELTNDIVQTFENVYKAGVLKPVKGIYSKIGRLPTPDGKAKMSKSLGNVLPLNATDKQIISFVNSLYPGMDGRQIKEPGLIEGNVILTYLDAFDPDIEELKQLKKRYAKGGVGDGEIKSRLLSHLLTLIAPIREKRAALKKDLSFVKQSVFRGTAAGRLRVSKVLAKVKTAIGINYTKSLFKDII